MSSHRLFSFSSRSDIRPVAVYTVMKYLPCFSHVLHTAPTALDHINHASGFAICGGGDLVNLTCAVICHLRGLGKDWAGFATSSATFPVAPRLLPCFSALFYLRSHQNVSQVLRSINATRCVSEFQPYSKLIRVDYIGRQQTFSHTAS